MRIAFKMALNKDMQDEYEKRHNPIWKELEDTLKDHGVISYSIFLDKETNELFACAQIKSKEQWEQIAQTDICKKWWEYMSPLMPTNPDKSPKTIELREVFHI